MFTTAGGRKSCLVCRTTQNWVLETDVTAENVASITLASITNTAYKCAENCAEKNYGTHAFSDNGNAIYCVACKSVGWYYEAKPSSENVQCVQHCGNDGNAYSTTASDVLGGVRYCQPCSGDSEYFETYHDSLAGQDVQCVDSCTSDPDLYKTVGGKKFCLSCEDQYYLLPTEKTLNVISDLQTENYTCVQHCGASGQAYRTFTTTAGSTVRYCQACSGGDEYFETYHENLARQNV